MRQIGIAFLWLSTCSFSEVPPQELSQTGLYSDPNQKIVAPENLAYEPQYPLWSDGAEKSRWLYLPPGTKINTGKPGTQPPPHMGNMNYWIFPVGTKVWKEFSFPRVDGSGLHRVETRLMEKLNDGTWMFASYVWDKDETKATLVDKGGLKNVYPITPEINHDIPSQSDCLSCHNRGGDRILGLDALQLSMDRDANALHAKPNAEPGITLATLANSNRVTYFPPAVLEKPPKILASNSVGRTAMGYLHSNCGNCHNPTGTAGHSWLFFRYPWDTKDEASSPAFETAINRMSTVIKIPDLPITLHIKPGEPESSSVIYAMKTSVDHHMPPIGTKTIDSKAIQLLEEWIRGL